MKVYKNKEIEHRKEDNNLEKQKQMQIESKEKNKKRLDYVNVFGGGRLERGHDNNAGGALLDQFALRLRLAQPVKRIGMLLVWYCFGGILMMLLVLP